MEVAMVLVLFWDQDTDKYSEVDECENNKI